MADEKAKIIVDGDVSPLRQKLREGASALKTFGDEGKASIEGIGGPLKTIQDKFIAISAILAGGAVFKAAVEQTAEWTQESVDLAAAFGMAANEASNLKAALASENVGVEDFVTAGQKLSAVLRTNEESLNQVGLVTRDAAGNLRPLNQLTLEAIGLLQEYKAGTDRAIASDIMFGRGFKINGDLAKINAQVVAEYTEKQRELGMVMSEENVAAFEAYEQAGKDTGVVMRAIQQTIGNALMPVLTKLANWFVSAGPAAVTVIKGAIGGLVAAFWALKNGIVVVWETLNAMVVTVAEPLRAVAEALFRAGTGDFKGAWEALARGGETIKNAWKGALAEIETSSAETWERIKALFAEGAPALSADTGGRSAVGLVNTGKDKTGKSASTTNKDYTDAEWANLEAEHMKSTLDEINRWRLEHEEVTNKAILEADKKLLEEMNAIHMLRLEGSRAAGVARIEELEREAAHELELGNITHEEYLARMRQYNEDRLAIEQQFIDAKKAMALEDPEQNVVLLEQLEQEKLEIRRRYAEQNAELSRQQATEAQSLFKQIGDSMSSLWDKMVNSIMQGTFTWRNLAAATFTEIAGIFGSMVKKMVTEWITKQVQMLIYGKTAAMSEIMIMAGKAGAGGVASMAAAPFPINLTAPAFGAQMAAAAMAYAPVASAAGGYDIPAGLNPVTQLHEEEMVLPAQLANAVREMAAAGAGSGAGAGGGTRIINAVDPSIVEEFLNSASGEKVILNVIRANPGTIKQMLY